MACGHGLLGVLLAYRFGDLKVTCVDLELRPGFDHYLQAFVNQGELLPGESKILSNLDFIESDMALVEVPE
jgi:hypothetical protein